MSRFLAGGVLAVLGLAWSAAPPAATVSGLYETEGPVAGQAAAERDRALRRGLLEVVVRVSGQRRVPPTGVLSGALQSPSRYVREYGYGAAPDAGGGARPGAGASSRLWARYDPAAVNQLVRQAGLPVWGDVRPQTLVWLAVERDGQPELLGAGDSAAVDAVVRSRSRARGLPLALPSLAGEDRGRVSAEDVKAGAVDRVTAASRRYPADVVVLGQARERVPGLWESRWTVVSGGTPEQFNVDGERLEKVVEEGLDRVGDAVATRYARGAPAGQASGTAQAASGGAAGQGSPAGSAATASGAAQGATAGAPVAAAATATAAAGAVTAADGRAPPNLVVTGVDSYTAYLRARRELVASGGVKSAQPAQLDPGRVTFHVKPSGDREAVSRSLSAGGALAPVEGSPDWTFQLAP